MATNQERAVELLYRAGAYCGECGWEETPDCPDCKTAVSGYVRALAEAGLLTPDMPRPDRDGRWWPTAARIGNVNTRAGRVRIHSGAIDSTFLSLNPSDARDLAAIFNAAADYAEATRAGQERQA